MTTEILRPSAAGYLMSLAPIPSGDGWNRIDEAVLDISDYVYLISAAGGWCFYDIPTPSNIQPADTINSVTVHAISNKSGNYNIYSDIGVYINSTQYAKGQFIPATTPATNDYTWVLATNPNTGVAWTYNDIVALQCGVYCKGDGSHNVKCYQSWVEIDYTAGSPPTPNLATVLAYLRTRSHQ